MPWQYSVPVIWKFDGVEKKAQCIQKSRQSEMRNQWETSAINKRTTKWFKRQQSVEFTKKYLKRKALMITSIVKIKLIDIKLVNTAIVHIVYVT